MRPPDLPGGNCHPSSTSAGSHACFNEAAGFTRRKRWIASAMNSRTVTRFNEAAGFTRRKHQHAASAGGAYQRASMRPPDLPGGNAINP